jgi:hypothetical protein
MATPQTNEQRLDAAEKILLAVIKDVRNNLSKYNRSDYWALNEAFVKLNAITLTDKTETLSRNFTELMPELLGEKAGIVSIPDSFWKPYDDYKEEQAKQA